MKDFDRFLHVGVKNELLRLRDTLSATSPGVQVGSSGDSEITIKGSDATAYARKHKRGDTWRLEVCHDGGGNVSYPETTNDVICELQQVFAADTSTAGLARTERSQRPSQPNEEIQSSDLIQRPSAAGASSTATDLQAIVTYWCMQLCVGGKWLHPDDEHVLLREPHSFNLDFPAGQYVGDILRAPVVILGANGGYSSRTPNEFRSQDCVQDFLARQKDPSNADWRSSLPPYYHETNYGQWLADGRVALVNACAYRSPKISEEPDNKRIVKKLQSVRFTRSWLLDVLITLAQNEQRLVVVKRPGLWNLQDLRGTDGIVFDPAPISARITGGALRAVQHFLAANPQTAK